MTSESHTIGTDTACLTCYQCSVCNCACTAWIKYDILQSVFIVLTRLICYCFQLYYDLRVLPPAVKRQQQTNVTQPLTLRPATQCNTLNCRLVPYRMLVTQGNADLKAAMTSSHIKYDQCHLL